MNTRDRIASGEQSAYARARTDAGDAMEEGADPTRLRFCADARFDDAFAFDCDGATAQALQTLAARCRSDRSTVAATAALGTLARLHGCEQLRVGVPMVQPANVHIVEPHVADPPGHFVDSCLVAIDPAKTVAQWLLDLSQSTPSLVGDTTVSLFLGRNEAFEAHLQLTPGEAGLHGHLAYAHALFDRAGAQRYVAYLQRMLLAMADDDAQPLDRIDLLDAAEHAQLAAWNATDVDYPAGQCVHHLFEAQVARTPDAVALRFEDQSLSYAELNRQANRLAHHLIALGVGPDVRVAICAERSLEMVICLYAILKAGGAYVPLDPAYPRERLAYQLDDSAPVLLLAQRALQAMVADATVPTLWLDDLAQLSTPEHDPRPAGLTAQNMVYVIYTSGSTGKPKGVMNQHDGVVNRLLWGQQQFALDDRDRVLQKTPFGFDVSVWELFLPLLTGAQLVMAKPAGHQDRQYLAECIQANAISAVHFVPSMLQVFVDQTDLSCCASLRHVMCSGEALPAGLQNQFLERLPDIALHNLYGPTEAAVEVSYWRCRPRATWVPIGRPIANTQLHVVDRHLRPVPVGVAGELLIGGVQVARGYLNRPELTDERFVADPFSPGGRLYKTGDLARWHEDGTIEYLGRNDFQVKIRGFRIELGEIEAYLCQHPQVREAVVLAREEQPGDLRLVAYVTGTEVAPQPEALRAHLSARLPQYMVPAAYVAMTQWPFSSNGKLDRKALPAPDIGAYALQAYEAPQGPAEIALAQIWSQMLRHERVGRHDNFFALGGHSLQAIELIGHMRRAGLQVDAQALFSEPTLQALAALTGTGTGTAAIEIPVNAIEPGCERIEPQMLPLVALTQADIDRIAAAVPGGAANIQDIYPLAPLQEGFLFHYLLESEGDLYLTVTALVSDGRERIERYAQALREVVARHDILRTSFFWDELPEPVQVVWREAPLRVDEIALDPADGDVLTQLRERFDPRRYRTDIRRAPLCWLVIAHDEPNDRWVALELLHHLIEDRTAAELMQQEVAAILDGHGPELPVPVPFREFVARTRMGVSREAHQAYFRGLLGDVDEPTAPFGLVDAFGDGSRTKEGHLELDPQLSRRLRGVARKASVSVATLAHLAWAMVLARACDRDDVVFGTVMSGRMHGGDAARAMGLFINTLPVRIRLDGADVREGVRRTHEALTGLLRHEHAPLNLAQNCSAVRAPLPLFTSLLNYRHSGEASTIGAHADGAAASWAGMHPQGDYERSNYPFDVSINDLGDDALSLHAQIDARIDAVGATPERVCAMLETALDSLARALEQTPDTALHALDVLPPDERRQVLEQWSGAEHVGEAKTGIEAGTAPMRYLHAPFEAHAARDPDAPALIRDGRSLSYGELNRRANRLAHYLIALGLQRDERVAIYMERSFDALIGMLAVLKAGGAYVPLDPAYPRERLHYMLADAAPRAVLTLRALRDTLPPGLPAVLALDEDDLAADCADTDPDRDALGLQPRHLAYVIYTSGSTGQPKGVMIEHRQVAALLHGLEDCYRLGAGDRVLQFSSLSFDASIEECFGALCSGAALVLREDEWLADAAMFWRYCREHGITMLSLPTAFWHQLGSERFGEIPEAVRLVVIGGEKANPELLARWCQDCGARPHLINAYGPTETTVDAIVLTVTGDPDLQHAIGRPLRHVRAYILDAHGQPAPVGVAGELYLGGAQVARGYLGRPELTAERFIASPFVAGDRLYKTGDLVRWREDGRIDYLGRNDFQVKIRGFRIELGEIEARLVAHDQVGEAVVVAREELAGDLRLVAYVTAVEAQTPDIDSLRAHLAAALPAYMLPTAYVLLKRLPLTANGKLDRKALPAPDAQDYSARGFEAPVGELETALARLWADTLKLERVGRRDHFFELGGHSLLAVTLLSRMRGTLALEVSLKDLFAHPVLAELAAHLHGRARREQRAIAPASREATLPLSHAQQRLWFLSQLDGASEAYHMPMALRLRGELDVRALRRALDRIVARHEVLRTTFQRIDGATVQCIGPADVGWALALHDLRGAVADSLQQRLEEEAARAFDLKHGPLVRGQLLRIAHDEHVLAITMHHIVSDGWSMAIFADELGALYAAYAAGGEGALVEDPLPPLPIQYADYALWQHQWLSGDVLRTQSGYWQHALAAAPALLELPTDRPRPAQQSFIGDAVPVAFDAALIAALRKLAQRRGSTLFMTVLAAWTAVLSRLSGQNDIVVGTAIANRTRPEIEPLIGFFVNTQAIRVQVGSGARSASSVTAAELLAQVKARVLEAQDHQDLPFEQVVEIVNPARNPAHAPIFQVMLAWQNLDEGELRIPGLDVSEVDAPYHIAKFDLGLDLSEVGDRLVGQLEYASALFDRASVERHVAYLRRMLEAMAADEHRVVAGIELIDADERARLLALGDGGDERADMLPGLRDLYSPVLAQARRTPDALAAIEPGRSVDYRELSERAHGVAWRLRELGVRPRDRVALLADRSIDSLIGVLGILAAGAAYVPIDPGYPDERIAYVLDDADTAALLIADERYAAQAQQVAQARAALAGRILDVAAIAPRAEAPTMETGDGDTAYVIYTSGSTGLPKGVIVPHRGALNLVRGFIAGHDFAGQRVLMIPPLVFDASVGDVFPALSVGAALVLHPSPADLDARELQRFCAEHRISAIDAPAALWRRWTDGLIALRAELRGAGPVLPDLRLMMFGGESVPMELVRRFSALTDGRVALSNHYGPTEASVCATMLTTYDGSDVHGADVDGAELPIGRPLPGVRVYLLDDGLALAPVGVVGELCLGGLGVADGYQGTPDKSAARFIADPFAAAADARLYRTGDRARWNADGSLQFLGRDDFQVKIRGFRIELGEIEARLAECPGCAEVAVLAREDRPGDLRLVAYVRAGGDSAIDIVSLQARLSALLPEYMVPAAYVVLERMPLTVNGKIDRKALPAPQADAYLARPYVAPVGATETALADVWSQVLKFDRIGRYDNFFELGGHSLLAVSLIERMRAAGLEVDVRTLFAAPTLQALAAAVGGAVAADTVAVDTAVPDSLIPEGCESIVPQMLPLVALDQADIDRIVAGVAGGAANVQDIYPLAPLQESILFHHALAGSGDVFLAPTLYAVHDRDDFDRYIEAVQTVIERHDVLRSALVWEGLPEPVQVVWRHAPLVVEEIELDPVDGDIATQLSERFDPLRYRLDLRKAPAWRWFIARDERNGRWVALELMHHIIGDHISLRLIHEEVAVILAGRSAELSASVPFRQFVALTRRETERGEYEAFFRDMLGDVDAPTAPFGLLDIYGDGERIVEANFELDDALGRRLRATAAAAKVTSATLCHLAWALLLARVCGREDVVFGTVIFGRMRAGENAERAIGPFINTLPLRLRVDAISVSEGVRLTHERLTDLLRHEHAPFGVAQRCSAVPAPQPLFTSLFNYRYQSTKAAGEDESGAMGGLRTLASSERTNFPLTVSVDDCDDGRFGFNVQVDAAVDPQRIGALFETALAALAHALEQAPDMPLNSLDVLAADERERVLALGVGARADVPQLCLHELFQAQAARTPDAPAVAHAGRVLSYVELNRRANRLAHQLMALGVGPDARVGLCLPRDPDLIVAALAVLKAGGAYVALDPDYPRERLALILDDSTPQVVIGSADTRAALPAILAAAWLTPDETDDAMANDLDPVVLGLRPEHLAYLIYTSGSTGTPKGVMIEHRNAVNFLTWAADAFGAGDLARTLFSTSMNFDLSVFECFAPLSVGGCVELVANALALRPETEASLLNTVPSALRAWLDAGAIGAQVHTINVAGEPLVRELAERMFAQTSVQRLCNLYGPSETTTYSTWVTMDRDSGFAPHIGRPVANTRIYVLDAQRRLMSQGAVGEIWIGGAGVARGYFNRPALTAERFLDDPFAPGERMYRTGDLGRWRNDGALEYLGRNDFQVKIRGFRIEPGEIEAQLLRLPGVREAVVLAREDARGDKRLVAYVVASDGASPDVHSLSEALAQILPHYMVPAAYVKLVELPLTTNGKLDRKALPDPDADAYRTRDYEPPQGELETALAQVWTELLKLERVGRYDSFFELGGHSLLAVMLSSRLRRAVGVEISLKDLFARPVLADMAAHLQAQSRNEQQPIAPAPRDKAPLLSYAQQRLWFFSQLNGASEAYHIPLVIRLRGELDAQALRRALDRIVARHEVLRTTFEREGGRIVQRIAAPDRRFDLRSEDLRSADETQVQQRLDEELERAFDLKNGPLLRGQLLRTANDEHVLAITMHHIVSDGWSMGVFTKELSALYAAYLAGEDDPLPSLPIQYADYAVWQRQWLDGEVLEKQSTYWREALVGAPALLELPTDRPRPVQQSFVGDAVPVEFNTALTAALRKLAQRRGTTLYMTVMAAWTAVLSRLSGQDDIVVGTAIANRTRPEIEPLIGFFVNTQAIRVRIGTGMQSDSVAELLAQIKARVLEAQDHQDLPFEQVVEIVNPTRSLARAPIFQVMLTWQNNDEGELILPGVRVAAAKLAHTTAKFDLGLDLAEVDGRIVGHLEFATALFDRATVQRYVGYLGRMLLAMAEDDAQPLDRIELLDAAERAKLLAWNTTDTDYPAGLCVHQLFEAQVERTPDAVALYYEDQQVSYAQLNAKADRLAHCLLDAGVTPGARVGIYLSRSPELLIAVLGALKAGAAYVPLEPKLPKERLGYMVQDAGIGWALLEAATMDELPLQDVDVILMDGAASEDDWLEDYAHGELPDVALSDVAYVIYTSGSTGRPKGVMVEHAGLGNYLAHAVESYLPGMAGAVVSSPLCFDATLTTLLPPLLAGKPVLLLPDETDTQTLARLSERLFAFSEGWLFKITPAHLDALAYLQREVASGQAPHCIVVGGEQLPSATLQRWKGELLPQASFVNEYGPTETVVGCSVWTLTREEQLAGLAGSAATPIGRPIGNTQLYVLGAHRQLQPIGSVGELYIGGAGVARGYLNRPELTQERFIANPFAAGRLYRTGDLVRYLGEGDLEFVGRIDDQVKIRGFRIELGEIEAQLLRQPDVREVAVLAREDAPGDKRLVAYVVAADGGIVNAHSLREALAQTLPDYMVPAAYVTVAELPLTANGKLDRRALQAPGDVAFVQRDFEAPDGAVETMLAGIWSHLLGVERVGRHDNFFELGGHSLLALRMLSQAHQHGFALVLADVFQQSTLAALAANVRESAASIARAAVVPIRAADAGEDEAAPLFLCHDGYGDDLYMHALTRHLPADLPVYGLPAQDSPEPPQVPAIAAAMLAAIRETQAHGPYRIGGWSFGGVLAYEIARQLRAQGEPVGFLGLIDSHHPSVYVDDSDIDEMPVEVLGQSGHALQAAVEAVPTNQRLLGYQDALRRYHPQPIDVVVQLFVAEQRRYRVPSALGWECCVPTAMLRVQTVPGDHYSMMLSPQIEVLAQALAAALTVQSSERSNEAVALLS